MINDKCRMTRERLGLVAWVAALSLLIGLGRSWAVELHGAPAGVVGAYSWTLDSLPQGRSAPHMGSLEGRYVLKFWKYSEAYVDLGQGDDGALRLGGEMTLTAVFQLAKQWPMRMGLISKWDYMEREASYELGLMPDSRLFFRVSGQGAQRADVGEVFSRGPVEKGEPTVVVATFSPGKRLAVYVNGSLVGESTEDVPDRCYDSVTPVRLGQRFEGLLAGVWFHERALSACEASAWSESLRGVMPVKAAFGDWTTHKRSIAAARADYLGSTPGMRLYKEIDISAYKGSYLCLGDLDGDGRVDYLLYKNGSAYTVPGRLTALDHDGKLLWEVGDTSLASHLSVGSAGVGQPGTTPALRGIATIYDIDQDGQAEVIAELWQNDRPTLCIIDGRRGEIRRQIDSPLDMTIRQPAALGDRQPSRSHPVIRIARLHGPDGPPSIVLKYGASNGIDCHAFALDASLKVLWHIAGGKHSMGHIPTVADVDADGKDEIVLGHMLADHDGRVMWDRGEEFTWHADTTAVADLVGDGGRQVVLSVCGVGPAYCLSPDGAILWRKTREEVEHGQAVWCGNFIAEEAGQEVIVCGRGHVGYFLTLRGSDGATLARFTHRRLLPAYPDFPTVVNWQSMAVQSLWIPQDRALVDGRGEVVAELGDLDEYVGKKLHCGTSWRPVGAQAFAVDLLGDERDELVLYEPYAGESIFIFANPDSPSAQKPYVAQPNAYNIRSYF